MTLAAGGIDIVTLAPEIILAATGCLALFASSPHRTVSAGWAPRIALGGVLLAILVTVGVTLGGTGLDSAGCGLRLDGLAHFTRIVSLPLGAVILLVSWSQAQSSERGEFTSMIVFSLLGLLMVAPANDMLVLFLALELVSIPTYVLVVLGRTRIQAAEAATKYFFLGALSAAVTAYGLSLLYGVAGTADLTVATDKVAAALSGDATTLSAVLASLGVLLTFIGLCFKIAAVPMHFYIADVYHGAASPVAGLLGYVPKLAGLIAIFKILALTGWATTSNHALFWTLWLVAAASMTVGNLLALTQTNIKRMLAYSGVAHSGYMLVGVLAGGAGGGLNDGVTAVLYYVVIYGVANLAAFTVLSLLRVRGQPCETLRDIAGLLRVHPGLALIMTLAMFTLMGLPPTPGFWGKLGLFGSALASAQSGVESHALIALVIIGVLNAALAAAYYLRVIAACLLYENDRPASAVQRDAQQAGVLVCALLLLAFMFQPTRYLLDRGRDASDAVKATTIVTEVTDSVAAQATSAEPSDEKS